uniref:Rx N-terminal domain-containing protein n=1 Tax=Oryza rufipogon TaxID=4529 RepID=A0A0E0Q3W1_ORYRU
MGELQVSSAHSAVDSLLGRLIRILEDEARLLGGVRGDVQFIKDEMESINGFLLHVLHLDRPDHQLQGWTRQVKDLARDCDNCVDVYMQRLAGAGSGGSARRLLRYGVVVPRTRNNAAAAAAARRGGQRGLAKRQLSEAGGGDHHADASSAGNTTKQDHRRRALLEEETPANLFAGETDTLVGWLLAAADEHRRPKVISIIRPDDEELVAAAIDPVKRALDDPRILELFQIRQWHSGQSHPGWVYQDMMTQILPMIQHMHRALGGMVSDYDKRNKRRYTRLKKKKKRIVVSNFSRKNLGSKGNKFPVGTTFDEVKEFIGGTASDKEEEEEEEEGFLQAAAMEVHEGFAMDVAKIISETMASEMGFHQGMTFQEMMENFLKDKSYLIVLDDVPDESLWRGIESAFPGNTAHSAILLTTRSPAVAYSCSPHDRVFPPLDHLIDFFHAKAVSLVENYPSNGNLDEVIRSILSKCASNSTDMCIRAFLHVLYANPNRNREELQGLCDSLHDSHGLMLDENMQQILMFWYNDLPVHYKSCLTYLSLFIQDDGSSSNSTMMIRRTSLVRRWAAESIITERNGQTALDEAERCFGVLLAKRFVLERDIGASGKIKSCAVNGLISKFITKVAREDNFVDADLQPDFAHRVSIWNRSQLQQVLAELQASPRPSSSSCWNMRKHYDQPLDDLTIFLKSLPAFSRLGLLKVLDLEGCDGLKDHHLENICKLFQLRYLNLRRSKLTKLPKKIQNLQQLETLDIRETTVSSFATKSLVLPMLKHLLSGYTQQQNEQTEKFSTVRMPRGIGSMTNLQVLCHVVVSGIEDELMDIGKLLQLRKLGVVFHGDQNSFKHLVQAIEKLHKSLISLSIRVEVPDGCENFPDMNMAEPTAFSYPKLLESLNICGIRCGLPRWIKELSRLAKLTLCDTHLGEQDMAVVGNLKALRYLRLRCRSYVQSKLTLGEKQFQHLKVLLIHGEDITDISFSKNPKLEKIVWSFREMKSISGIERLPSLRSFELHGDCNPDKVEIALKDHPNHPDLEHHGNRQGQGDAAGSLDADAASTCASVSAPNHPDVKHPDNRQGHGDDSAASTSASASASAPKHIQSIT